MWPPIWSLSRTSIIAVLEAVAESRSVEASVEGFRKWRDAIVIGELVDILS